MRLESEVWDQSRRILNNMLRLFCFCVGKRSKASDRSPPLFTISGRSQFWKLPDIINIFISRDLESHHGKDTSGGLKGKFIPCLSGNTLGPPQDYLILHWISTGRHLGRD